ncbi:type II toxin-antitoxin system VapB family antitoxin [Microbacterium sp. MPKO10]|uniref:type II toxin-antitoxin system VapB family antitoxin n=1 Tax=Microbacterium sp. MPKO10 TaxID=2989818 RepID=UPI002235AA3B|nr:type II toxin-antitoxin system VapB family antitoxin [Microbacterium sp. MPKO10]MCW4457245.1 type II toxin-antitoxin system VapB family antitoxin [Microbacterium sp. MPKO10]
MGLNIKNERTHEVVRRLAQLEGMSQTSVVEDAVRRRLDQLAEQSTRDTDAEAERRYEQLTRIAEEFSAGLTDGQREDLRHSDEWLYDDAGLPA